MKLKHKALWSAKGLQVCSHPEGPFRAAVSQGGVFSVQASLRVQNRPGCHASLWDHYGPRRNEIGLNLEEFLCPVFFQLTKELRKSYPADQIIKKIYQASHS